MRNSKIVILRNITVLVGEQELLDESTLSVENVLS